MFRKKNFGVAAKKRRPTHLRHLGLMVLCTGVLSVPAPGQTTSFTAVLTTMNHQSVERLVKLFVGTAGSGTLGNAVLRLNLSQQLSADYLTGQGPVRVGLTLATSREDTLSMGFQDIQDPTFLAATVTGRVAGGTGAYSGASNASPLTLTLAQSSTSPLRYNVSLSGAVTVSGQTLDVSFREAGTELALTDTRVFDNDTGACSVPPFGDGKLTLVSQPDTHRWDDKVNFIEANITCEFSDTDSVRAFVIVRNPGSQLTFDPVMITGGTGEYAGVSGTAQVTDISELPNNTERVTLSGALTLAGPATPIITEAHTAYWIGGNVSIAQNAWIEIKGRNLAPAATPAGGMFWSDAPEFAQGKMPTEVGGVSVTVNGKPAFVWWFCSAATTAACATDQINVLTPLDDYEHQVAIVVKNGPASSAPFMTAKGRTTPSPLLFSVRGDVVATHPDGSLVGPRSLFPGYSTPAQRGETISIWGVGFGLPTTAVEAGSSTQRGSLPYAPVCYVGGRPAPVTAALVSPGLYQFNVTVADDAAGGDNLFYCTIPSGVTFPALVAVE